jgi:hypothetical protein
MAAGRELGGARLLASGDLRDHPEGEDRQGRSRKSPASVMALPV